MVMTHHPHPRLRPRLRPCPWTRGAAACKRAISRLIPGGRAGNLPPAPPAPGSLTLDFSSALLFLSAFPPFYSSLLLSYSPSLLYSPSALFPLPLHVPLLPPPPPLSSPHRSSPSLMFCSLALLLSTFSPLIRLSSISPSHDIRLTPCPPLKC